MDNFYPKNGRVILHVDMNSFYASVEMAYNPSLKGKPLAVAGNPEERRGIIVTCSYEARAKGVKTTMPLWEAKKLCPELIVLPPDFEKYRKASISMFKILAKYSSLIQPVSIDEGYMDITDCINLGSPIEIAKKIQAEILTELQLPCSIGIAPNKFLAKTASDMKKPLGITILRKRDVPSKLWPLKVENMHGIGRRTAEKLNKIGITTIGELAKANDYQLKQLLGINGIRLKARANGEDLRPVDPDAVSEFKSIGNSTTLKADTTDEEEIKGVLNRLAGSVERRMQRHHVVSWNIQITIRYYNRETVTRSRKLKYAIHAKEDIFNAAWYLFKKHWSEEPIRLLGITAQDLEEKNDSTKQLNLFTFEEEAKDEPLINTMEKLKDKYGDDIIVKGLTKPPPTNTPTTSFQKDFLQDYKWRKEE
ncbi:nucleotidyltransferase/DNA polymerase involved in DNA repair [Schinkia azotoformans MEV2011]|uniref:DNA polymerase IV n=1 Tax=Schinkia azotoformans MEV2011 TaxID=1348973 RepID=A0A072NVU5_SCHAZ|nr:DNA polymerase IV [Schinkia azotoformans]KEF37370.1 nucleotidyltransferase/DNA polymerase involved in DNA repair [Schinkia azotoformans MEV2011]MEC1694593.1 DNA polymerase IV [Schinkia azotoformans]MEC1725654.1 DNA polymerase IV [Schinkia azotoformans]MEC1769580.1 DNA polymerase IV [Schinkia azotoformans]MEC1780741.1 DNA polymerase IV [Schinkia azotoformans]